LTYLPTSAIRTGLVGALGRRIELAPALERGGRSLEPERLEDQVVDALLVVGERHLVDVVDVVGRHDGLGRQRREQRDLLADVVRQPDSSGT
jgi:hypothetical protein